jgi:hypothetical protein
MDVEQVGESHWMDIEQGFLQKKLKFYMCHGYEDSSFQHTHTSRVLGVYHIQQVRYLVRPNMKQCDEVIYSKINIDNLQ